MQAFLDDIRAKGYQMVLASASKNAPKVLKYLKLSDYFDGIVNPASVKHGKPAPDIYIAAAEMMNLPVANVAGLEDAQAGVQAINDAGELSIGIGAGLDDADIRFDATKDVTLEAIKAQLD